MLTTSYIFSQGIIKGKITNKNTGKPLANANVIIQKINIGTVTDSNGLFEIKDISAGRHKLVVSYIGFTNKVVRFSIASGEVNELDIKITPTIQTTDEVVITATKTSRTITSIPTRIEVISSRTIEMAQKTSIDNLLLYNSGINVSRPMGILDHKSIVSMRGLGGSEQSRTLVLIDGIPFNKADGGSVNWNLINPNNVEKIEISKGAVSSLYGGNAMGGVINIITKQIKDSLTGNVNINYGTYNTIGTNFNVSDRISNTKGNGFYWGINGFYHKSDGYVSTPEEERDSTTIKQNMEEVSTGIKLGYDFNASNNIEFSFTYFDDFRGTGTKIYDKDGTCFNHTDYTNSIRYKGKKGKLKWNTVAYYNFETFYRLSESIKNKHGQITYKTYDVSSDRTDLGLLFNSSIEISDNNLITAGIDIKKGQVDASDNYHTSTDIVINKGEMDIYSMYLQDELSFFDKKLLFIGGVRFDYTKFYEGVYNIENGTNATSILNSLINKNLDENSWNAISPKFSVQYRFNDKLRSYISYSRGFRPSVLDDLCRSGFISGGFKIANPNLEAEKLDNIELGIDYTLNNLKVSTSLYASKGKDFMYYISTGDSIAMGSRLKPIRKRANISEVEIFGAELDILYQINSNIRMFANYTYNHSEIKDFTTEFDTNLSGMTLTYVPKNMISGGISWQNRFVNASANIKYLNTQYKNDINTEKIDPYSRLDIRFWKNIKNLRLGLSIQNLTDEVHIESHGNNTMGRYISTDISYKF